ncbi:hypothetical protein [Psychroserpens sp. Hel_I_66]|uniref:hypothetical protein n=1 Tax=Psychroserpens sp. Hel_I_66 TaxID=1250004 RepID=UPI0006469536|nr:hypothetical protein [Psychroserpens sp. Hel_I_66]
MKNTIIIMALFFFFGSFAQESIYDGDNMCRELKEMINNDQLYRSKLPDSFSRHKSKYSKKEIDSMQLLQRKIDDHNTEKLIDLTKQYGWISDERINCQKLNIWLIFRHSQPKYFKDISVLIEKEHDKKRLSDFHYKMINDHINGRPRG